MDIKRILRGPLVWILLAVLLGVLFTAALGSTSSYSTVHLSQLQGLISAHDVKFATVQSNSQLLQVVTNSGQKLQADFVSGQGPALVGELQKDGIGYTVVVTHSNELFTMLLDFAPIILIVLLFLFLMNQMQGGGARVMNFGKSKAKMVSKDTPKTTFADVAGSDEAIEELQEIKDFLQTPAKFQAMGAKIPKGVLLYGPPGTGKTLLARAVAGEAGVPFYSISGSDFVEMFVGVGASRVRDLFEQAKANAPAIIFVDEIDAVGRHRGAGLGGGHDEREQTLNQLLVEMDGFDVKGGVILIAATNRPDILDPALLRPGRFDRQIVVDRPDLEGRKGILAVHARGKPLGPDVDLGVIARRTPGFTGADLANVINEAALLTARGNERLITAATLEEAIDRVMAGPERKTRPMSERERKVIAYHEGGHALVAHALPNTDPVHKVTIIPRGRALGYTMQLPLEDKYLQTRSEMIDQLAVLMGGRTAEELVFHEPTTGAANDIEKVTAICRAMVTQYGMSDRLGALKFGHDSGEVFLGREMGHQRDYSESVAGRIDEEIRTLVEEAHDEAYEVLVTYRHVLDELVLRLMDTETLSQEEVLEVFAQVTKRPSRGSFTGAGKRLPSTIPPVLTPAEMAVLNASDLKALTAPQPQPAAANAPAKSGSASGLRRPASTRRDRQAPGKRADTPRPVRTRTSTSHAETAEPLPEATGRPPAGERKQVRAPEPAGARAEASRVPGPKPARSHAAGRGPRTATQRVGPPRPAVARAQDSARPSAPRASLADGSAATPAGPTRPVHPRVESAPPQAGRARAATGRATPTGAERPGTAARRPGVEPGA